MGLKVHPKSKTGLRISLDSSLDSDLGFDSLARIEFLLQVERTSGSNCRKLPCRRRKPWDRSGLPCNRLRQKEGLVSPLGTSGTASLYPGNRPEPTRAGTLLEVLTWHVRADPDRTQITYTSEADEVRISYGTLKSQAEAVGAGLQREGLRPRQTVAIMMPTCPGYFYAYFGILLAGGIPVPIYPPARLSQIEEHVRRHAGILNNAQCAVLITIPEAMIIARLLEWPCQECDG